MTFTITVGTWLLPFLLTLAACALVAWHARDSPDAFFTCVLIVMTSFAWMAWGFLK